MAVEPGTRLGPYEIIGLLGAGGMGEVYRARDTRLGRDVAVKVLPNSLAADPERIRRFQQEARAAGALNHPNIVTVYDVGEFDQSPFLVTEALEGESLRDRLDAGALPVGDAAEVAVRLAEGLAAAHEKGIVHRDLKPGNVFLTKDGRVKILDFGIAKLLPGPWAGQAETLTSPPAGATSSGAVLGTVGYMAPEQVRGLAVDHRADVFAIGCVLLEMIAGRRAFAGATAADTMTAILSSDPSGLDVLDQRGASRFTAIVKHCLEKDPARRFQSAADVAFALRQALEQPAAGGGVRSSPVGGPAGGVRLVAVLPLENLSGDPEQEYFAAGMTDALVTDLSRIQALRVISRTTMTRYRGANRPAGEIARELGADAVVEGSVFRAGNRVRIAVRLVHAATDTHVLAESYERDLTDVLSLQGEVATDIARQVQARLTPKEHADLAQVRTVEPRAYEAYLRGCHELGKRSASGAEAALRYLAAAIELDPKYAPAFAGIADAYMVLGTGMVAAQEATLARPKGKAAALRAIELAPDLPEGHAALAAALLCYDWDWSACEAELERAIAFGPTLATPHHWYALLHAAMGRLDAAMTELSRAHDLEPLSLPVMQSRGTMLYYAARFDEAAQPLREALDIDPGFGPAHHWLGRVLGLAGAREEAIAELTLASTLAKGSAVALGALAHALGSAGRAEEARAILARLDAMSRETYVPAYSRAEIHMGLGDADEALRHLRRALGERSDLLIWLNVEPVWAPVRGDRRFLDLTREVGLPAGGPRP